MAVTIRYLLRNDTAESWENANPVLLKGEPGFDQTNRRLKFGDGATRWNDLPYVDPPVGVQEYEITGFDANNEPSGVLIEGKNYAINRDTQGKLVSITCGSTTWTAQYDEQGRFSGMKK